MADPDAGSTEPPAPPPRTDGCPEDAPLPLDRVRIQPAFGQGAQLVGARVQGSNSGPTTDFVDLATITAPLADGAFAELTFTNTARYRYLRYYAPPASRGGVAEIELYHGASRLSGSAFGTAGATPFAAAFDGDPSTSFVPAAEGGGYAGLDIAGSHVTDVVRFTPPAGDSTTPVRVSLATSTAGATIRYTSDGSNPSATTGTVYSAPIALATGSTSIRALATSDCRFDSPISAATYTIGTNPDPVERGLKSYHIGNSLTDTINPWLEPIADSTGVDHVYARWTIPGAPIKWLKDHQGEGFQDPDGANRFDSFVQEFAPIDHLSLQPYSDPSFEGQGGAAVELLTTALRANPNIQFWIYAQWAARTEWTMHSFSVGGGSVYPQWQVPRAPTNWEEATENAALYFEAFRDYVDSRVGGKPFLIVPGGLAMVALKRAIEAGDVPGFDNFFDSMYEDEVHLTRPAQYFVALVFYSCLYRQSPEGRVTSSGTGLTAEQARIFQRIAWNASRTYAGSGVSR